MVVPSKMPARSGPRSFLRPSDSAEWKYCRFGNVGPMIDAKWWSSTVNRLAIAACTGRSSAVAAAAPARFTNSRRSMSSVARAARTRSSLTATQAIDETVTFTSRLQVRFRDPGVHQRHDHNIEHPSTFPVRARPAPGACTCARRRGATRTLGSIPDQPVPGRARERGVAPRRRRNIGISRCGTLGRLRD